jgi:hypothetical protein
MWAELEKGVNLTHIGYKKRTLRKTSFLKFKNNIFCIKKIVKAIIRAVDRPRGTDSIPGIFTLMLKNTITNRFNKREKVCVVYLLPELLVR